MRQSAFRNPKWNTVHDCARAVQRRNKFADTQKKKQRHTVRLRFFVPERGVKLTKLESLCAWAYQRLSEKSGLGEQYVRLSGELILDSAVFAFSSCSIQYACEINDCHNYDTNYRYHVQTGFKK
jgi:hypothetical protein